ncbi:MAG TPA: hypothetical protein VIM61_15400 [Chthoniobacterales bacterium]
MNALRLGVVCLAICGGLSAQAEVVDTLFMNDAANSRRVGRVVGIDATSFKVEVPLAVGGAAGAKATVNVPRARVSRVEFAPNENRDKLIANPISANLTALNVEWLRWQAFLGVPKSPAAALGNAYGVALVVSNDPKRAAEALQVFNRIEKEAWNPADRQTAKQGRLRAMVASGNAAQAVVEAGELARNSDDPTVLIEAKFLLAEAAAASLRKLVEDNPRWQEDVLVRPEYDRLYNESLDLYLHPYLFLGSETEAASRGLWGAVKIYQFGGDKKNAAESARDLVTLYPTTRFATLAKEYLARNPVESPKPATTATP